MSASSSIQYSWLDVSVFLAWLAVLVPGVFILWCFAAFVLRCSRGVRLVVVTLVPILFVAGFLYIDYWAKRTPPAEPGWDIFFALTSVVAGVVTSLATIPTVWLAEKFLGERAP